MHQHIMLQLMMTIAGGSLFHWIAAAEYYPLLACWANEYPQNPRSPSP